MHENQIRELQREKDKPGHGAVGIVVEDEQFLVIRRSPQVRAPNMLCFAGGTVEPGESPEQTVVREMQEELNLTVNVHSHVWQSVTRWGTLLEWFLVHRDGDAEPVPNTAEVSEWMWLTAEQLLTHPDRLPSVPHFFVEWSKGTFDLPKRAGRPDPKWQHLTLE